MYSTIVVGTDGSDGARVAVGRAGELAALTGASLHLLHGYGNPTAMVDPMAGATFVMSLDDVKALEDRLRPQADEIRAKGVEVVVHVAPESGADAILGYAESVDADLIVVGNRGMTGKRRFILGSVPNSVSHHAPCSVLIVRTD